MAGAPIPPPMTQAGVSPEMAAAFKRNQPFLNAGPHNYNTYLLPQQEEAFRQWVKENQVAFDPNAGLTDYDMRGFWLAQQRGDPRATTHASPLSGRVHYNDYWKTPYDLSFSRESQWADPAKAPHWEGNNLILPDGTVLFTETAKRAG